MSIDPKPKAHQDAKRARTHQEDALDDALKNTFPASDPVSIGQPTPPVVDGNWETTSHVDEARPLPIRGTTPHDERDSDLKIKEGVAGCGGRGRRFGKLALPFPALWRGRCNLCSGVRETQSRLDSAQRGRPVTQPFLRFLVDPTLRLVGRCEAADVLHLAVPP